MLFRIRFLDLTLSENSIPGGGIFVCKAMTTSGKLDNWRNYFRTANSDIFGIIENAIMVAASDCPQEFRLRRDRIAETLFSSKLSRCTGCDRVELAVPGSGEDGTCKSASDRNDGCEFEVGASKESNANSSRDDQVEQNVNHVSNYSYLDAEALTDEIEEASQLYGEILRLKEIVRHSDDQPDSVLFDALRRLQLMPLTLDVIQSSGIGVAVKRLHRRHRLKQIRDLTSTLMEEWKVLVETYLEENERATAGGTEGTPDSMNPSVVVDDDDDGGLPSPPLDEAFFATQPQTMELSQFFDGIDDYGNPHENGRKPSTEKQNVPKWRQQPVQEANVLPKDKKINKQEVVSKSNKPLLKDSVPGRPLRLSGEQKVNSESKLQQKADRVSTQKKQVADPRDVKTDGISTQKRQVVDPRDRSVAVSAEAKLEAVSAEAKLEAAKRKLQEGYRQAENAKRQRTIQVMELRDLPKQGHPKQGSGQKNQQRAGNRHWSSGRR